MMMESAEQGMCRDASDVQNRTKGWRIRRGPSGASLGSGSRVNNLLCLGNDRFFEHFLKDGATPRLNLEDKRTLSSLSPQGRLQGGMRCS
jgi:hypothetical protein